MLLSVCVCEYCITLVWNVLRKKDYIKDILWFSSFYHIVFFKFGEKSSNLFMAYPMQGIYNI